MSIECARAYYEYGNALLNKEEENPSHGLLGNVDGGAGEDAQKDEHQGQDESKNDDEGDEEDDEEGEEEEVQDDLQIAWEVLDVSRHS